MTNPAIGVQMVSFHYGSTVEFYVKIKNTGDETLFNITAADATPGGFAGWISFEFSGFPIASLAPGEEVTDIPVTKYGVDMCFDYSSILVSAVTVGGTAVSDLSADSNGHDNNGVTGSYYNDIANLTYSVWPVINATQDGVYEDSNNNAIVDVGDVVNYFYTINSAMFVYYNCEISDNNAIVENPIFDYNGNGYFTTGKHYLTQADVDLGYVYNSSYLTVPNSCIGGVGFSDASYCNACPNPGVNIVTKLTSSLPNTISGAVKFNANSDCSTAFSFPNRRVTATAGAYEYTTFTNASGNYSLLIPNSGTYATSALSSLTNNFTSAPASIAVTSSGENNNYANTDFCISSSTNYSDLRVNLFNINQAIPGFNVNYRIYYENIGSTNLNGTIKITLPPDVFLNFSPNPLPDDFTSNTLTWNYPNLLPFESRYIDLGFLLNLPPTVNTGDVLTLTVEGMPLIGDNDPGNNTFTLNQTVFSSFDPNDKTVLEGENITSAQAAGYLTYVTRFQNTGTANATTVVVKETLDTDLDWNTFEPIGASHNYNIQLRNGNDLTYTFSNIGLPYESANEPASHGWLAYRIKPKSTFAIGDIASASSNIYFDFNTPVVTNTVNTQIVPLTTEGFIKSSFVIYPNPADDFVNIKNKNHIQASYEITDSNGKLLQAGKLDNTKTVDVSRLQSGFYFLTVKTTEGKATYKLLRK